MRSTNVRDQQALHNHAKRIGDYDMKLATNVMAALVVLGTSAVVTSSADAATVVRSVNHGPNCTTTTVRVHEHGVLRTRTVHNCAPVVHTAVVVHRPVVHTGVVVHAPVVH